MLKINRIKIEIKSENGIYGIDESFSDGLNLIASEDNTCGKSSILIAIYYCLGFEEIIGGKGGKVLTSVYKSSIEDGDKVWSVLESGAYLEINNGKEIVTVYRAVQGMNRDCRLITVFYSSIDNINNPQTVVNDMYVHMPNSAVNEKGFHSFLEKFLFLELPTVSASDDTQRKLYLQLIFSCMFIEQKHGWADILSGIPILGIKESKKRVLEFILNLDTLDNEKTKERLKLIERSIKYEWDKIIKECLYVANSEECEVLSIPKAPRILTEEDLLKIVVVKDESLINDKINQLQEQYNNLKSLKPIIIDNFDELQNELQETELVILEVEKNLVAHYNKLAIENESIKKIDNSLETIDTDLRNNKDAARLRELGSEISLNTSKDTCPVCNQSIHDTLLPYVTDMHIMSIDENIRHLEAQRDMLKFSLHSHKKNRTDLKNHIENMKAKLFTLRRLAKYIRSDLYSTNDELSEAMLYKRISIQTYIENLIQLEKLINKNVKKIDDLSKKWKEYLEDKEKLPKRKLSELDEEKINALCKNFIKNLKLYGYKSVLNLNDIEISRESYLPIIEGFDMKFDSSASDNIRAIWAFTISLLETSLAKQGNHPNILIFDEPAQHSIITNDMEKFFSSVISLKKQCQVLIGITIKDSDTKHAIEKLPETSYKMIVLPNKAFKKQK